MLSLCCIVAWLSESNNLVVSTTSMLAFSIIRHWTFPKNDLERGPYSFVFRSSKIWKLYLLLNVIVASLAMFPCHIKYSRYTTTATFSRNNENAEQIYVLIHYSKTWLNYFACPGWKLVFPLFTEVFVWNMTGVINVCNY